MKRKGNILAISLIVSTFATLGAIAIGSIALKDTQIAATREDAQIAYQTANSMLDIGLLYYKNNPNAELASLCLDANDPVNCTPPTADHSTNKFVRIYQNRLGCTDAELASSTNKCHNLPVHGTKRFEPQPNSNPPADEQVGDLKIWYRQTGGIGIPDNLDKDRAPITVNQNPIVKQDQPFPIAGLKGVSFLQLSIAGLNVADWVNQLPDYDVRSVYKDKTWQQAREIFKTQNGRYPNPTIGGINPSQQIDKDFYNFFCNKPDVKATGSGRWHDVPCGVAIINPANRTDNYSLIDMQRYQDQLYVPQGNEAGAEIKVNDSDISNSNENYVRIKPINMDLQLALKVLDSSKNPLNNALIDSGITHIQSIGYYGKSKRILEVQIDRIANTLLGTFDFTVYSGKEGLPPN